MQITQELCKRPGLNRAGFDMQTIYVPDLIDKVLSFNLINTLMDKFCQQCLFRCCQIHNFGLFTYVDVIVMGRFYQRVDTIKREMFKKASGDSSVIRQHSSWAPCS